MNILSFFNQGWVGALIGLIGVIYAMYSYKKSKIGARLVYQVESFNVIEQKNQSMKEVDIYYKGVKVPRIIKTKIIIWNSGYKEIDGSKIVKSDSLKLRISEGESIINAEITAKTKLVNEFIIEIDETKENILYLNFDYLDPNDGVTIEILHTDDKKILSIEGSIKGMPNGILDLGSISNSLDSTLVNSRVIMSSRFLRMAFITGLLFTVTAILLPIFNPVVNESLANLNFETVEVRIIAISVGLFYTIVPMLVLFVNRKRYPKQLDTSPKVVRIRKKDFKNQNKLV